MWRTAWNKSSGRSGAALIVALWLLAILSLTALGLAYRTHIAIKDSGLSRERLRALCLCKAMVSRAVMELERDTNEYDARNESWWLHRDFKEEGWLDEMGLESEEKDAVECEYSVWDESGRIAINLVGDPYLYNLEALEPAQASSILDWIDADASTRPGGAESDWYERLTPSYRAKNAPIQALEELLAVKEITPEMFFGEVEDTASFDAPYHAGLRAHLTVYGEDGLINLNTATPEVLAAISPNLSEETVSRIAQGVRGPDGVLGTYDDDPFHNLTQLEGIYGITDLELAMLKSRCTVKSSVFSILCRVTIGGGKARKTIHAVVARDADSGWVKIAAWREN